MFYIRPAKIEDGETLLKLAKMVHFINLPADKSIIDDKISRSRGCFRRAAEGDYSRPEAPQLPSEMAGLSSSTASTNLYMFVLEDTDSPGCLGTCQLIASMGGPGAPNVSFKLERRELYSTSLKFGSTQVVAQMYLDESSPTEIGGLILQPSLRGHPARLGKFLSIVRFHFIALHRAGFADEILAEMMGPTSPDGQNLFWDYLGRRFIPLSYPEADRFCQHSREFMVALMPKGEVYLSLLPPEARSVIGEVGAETVPARRMLEKLGFRYQQFIDPFDGGPNLRAKTDEVPIVRDTRIARVGACVPGSRARLAGITSSMTADGDFRAVQEPVAIDGAGNVCLTAQTAELLGVRPGDRVGFTPTDAKSRAAMEKARAQLAVPKSKRHTGGEVGAALHLPDEPAKKTKKRARKKAGA